MTMLDVKKKCNNMETNCRFIEIEGIDVPILLEEGLDVDFAKSILSKCDKNDFNDGDVIIINKEKMYVLHKTEPVCVDTVMYPNDMVLCNKDEKPITLTDSTTLIGNFNDLDLKNIKI